MPRLTILDGDSLRPVSRAENGHLKGLNNYVSATRGNHHWVIVSIDQINDCRKIEFEAEFRYKASEDSPNEQRQYSRVGIWTSVQDSPKILSLATSKDNYATGTGVITPLFSIAGVLERNLKSNSISIIAMVKQA